jgi:putative RecB family exonuclease
MIHTTKTLDDLRLMPHGSYSAVNQFLRICQAQFAFQRVWKLKPAFVTESLPFGTAFHRTAEIFRHQRAEGADASADMLADLFVRIWHREVAETPNLPYQKDTSFDSLLAQGQSMIRAYRNGIGDLGEVIGVNVPFRIPRVHADGVELDRPIIGEFGLLLGGPGGQVTCADLKTAGQRYSETKLATGLQPTVYLAAARHMFPNATVYFRWYAVLKTKRPELICHATDRTLDDFTRLGELIRVAGQCIDAGLLLPSEGSHFCSGYGFAELCRRTDWMRSALLTVTGSPAGLIASRQ